MSSVYERYETMVRDGQLRRDPAQAGAARVLDKLAKTAPRPLP